MAARGVTAAEVAAAIPANNFQSAPGQAKGYFTVVDIVADTGLKSLDDFRDMVVKSEDGGARAAAATSRPSSWGRRAATPRSA